MTTESVAFSAIVFAGITLAGCSFLCWSLCRVMSVMAADLEQLRQERFDRLVQSMERNQRLQDAEDSLARIRREIIGDDDDA